MYEAHRRKGFKRQRSFSLPNMNNADKLQQILDYNHTEEKLSKLLGIDAPTVREVNSAQHEGQLFRERTLGATSQNKRNAKKALAMLGHDLSREKVKKTLGIDDDSVEQIEKEKMKKVKHSFSRKRAMSAPTMDKRHAVKALSRLGLDISTKKAMQLLGLNEDVIKEACSEQLQKREERITRQRESSATLNKKNIQKALNVMGYNPSLEKVMDTLGVEVGSDAESEIRTVIPTSGNAVVVGKYSKRRNQYSPVYIPYLLLASVGAMVLAAAVAKKVG